MSRNLMLHVGPPRVGTTWLWDLIINNKLYNSTVKLNHSHNQLEFLHKVNTATPQNDQQRDLLAVYQFAINMCMKEDLPMYSINQQCMVPGTGPRGAVLDRDKYIEMEQLFRNKLSISSQFETSRELMQWYSKLTPQHSSIVNSYAALAPMIQAFHSVMPHTTDHVSTERITNYENNIYNAIKFGEPGVDSDWEQRDVWELRMVPNWCRLEAPHQLDDAPRTVLTSDPQMGCMRYNVDKFNGTASVEDYITNWLPAQQQYVLDCVNALSSQYDRVIVIIGLRDPTEQYVSRLNLASRVFHHKIMRSPQAAKRRSEQLQYASVHDIRIHSLMNMHRNSISNASRDAVRYYYHNCVTQSTYAQLRRLSEPHSVPVNCEIRTYHQHLLSDSDYVNTIFAEILPDDVHHLNNFGEKSFASSQENLSLQSDQYPPVNHRLLAENIRAHSELSDL